MNCWTCGTPLELISKVSFRATCETCHACLHCCRNCVYYKPGLPNDCMVPNTDYVADRAANNFCEEFKLLGKKESGNAVDPKTIAKKLFGDEKDQGQQKDPKKRFNDLFEK